MIMLNSAQAKPSDAKLDKDGTNFTYLTSPSDIAQLSPSQAKSSLSNMALTSSGCSVGRQEYQPNLDLKAKFVSLSVSDHCLFLI